MKENIIRFLGGVYNLNTRRNKKENLSEEFGKSVDKLFSMTPKEADEYMKKRKK